MTPRSGLRLGLALVLAVLAAAASARAEAPGEPDPSALCDAAIVKGARRGGVPVEVLFAVALTETGQHRDGRMRAWPWAINREGKGYWFKTRDEALAFGQQSLAAGRKSFDVGCVQINYRWHGHAFPSLEDMFDPEWTATYAAQFLRTLYEERGSWSEAAGAYHSLEPGIRLQVSRPLRPPAGRSRAGGAHRRRGAGRRRPAAGTLLHAPGAARGAAARNGREDPRRRPAAPAAAGRHRRGALRAGRRRALRARARRSSPEGQPLLSGPPGSLF